MATVSSGVDPARPERVQRLLDRQLGIEDGALMLRDATLTVLSDRRGWIARTFGGERC